MRFSIYIDGTIMDLYQDESVVLNRQVKDLRSIESVMSDYTQSFTIPATPRNNKVFSHWYNVDVVNGFNAHKKVDARIEVDGLETFRGIVELRNVSFQGYDPTSYEIVFYGEAKKLATSLGDKMLADIDWSDYNHTRSIANVKNSWAGTLLSGKILYPVMGLKKVFNYNADSGATLSNNIAKANNITNTDLRPSILLTEMVKHVIQEQGYTTQGGFYTDTYFDDLYVMPSAYSGTLNRVNVDPVVTAERFALFAIGNSGYRSATQWTEQKDNTNSYNPTSGIFTAPTAGDYNFTIRTGINQLASGASLDVTFHKNNTALTGIFTTNYMSTGSKTSSVAMTGVNAGDEIEVRYKSTDSGAVINDLEFKVTSGPSTPSDSNVNMGEVMPKIKASVFLNDVMKTFNLVLVPVSENRIDVEVYQSWLEDGSVKNMTQYADISNVKHEKIEVPSKLSFKHSDATDFINAAFTKNRNRQFGSVTTQPSVDFSGAEIKVESPFTIFPQAVLHELNNSGGFVDDTNIQFYHQLDGDSNPVTQDLLLFYYTGQESSDTWYFASESRTTFPTISAFADEPSTTSTNSLGFSLESVINGDAPTNTILEKFWLKYLSRIFSTQSRKVILDMYLPVGEWLKLELNDTIQIGGYYYKVDSVKYDLLSQKAQMTLLTYPDVEVTAVTGSSVNTYDISTASANDAGQTFIGLGAQSDALGNIIRVNDVASTDAPNEQQVNSVQVFVVVTDSYSEQDLGDGQAGGQA